MQKLAGHWVAKRVGIVEHYKSMTVSEIVLFDAYLLLANKETWECWRTIRQLSDILPLNKRTIIRAKNALEKKGWIEKKGKSGVFIVKMFRFENKKIVTNGEQKVTNREQDKVTNEEQKVTNREQDKVTNEEQEIIKVTNEERQGDKWGTKGDKWGTIIEDDSFIKKKIYVGTSDEFRLSKLLLDLIQKRKPDFKKPDLQKWAVHIDRMIRLDERDPQKIAKVIRWCQLDNFWQNNILSTEKLRNQFDQLELKMNKGKNAESVHVPEKKNPICETCKQQEAVHQYDDGPWLCRDCWPKPERGDL